MDPITHTLIGAQLGRAGPLDRVRERVWLLVFASLIPDIDFIAARLLGPMGFMARRMYTHSLVGILLISLISALILSRFNRYRSKGELFGFVLLGMSIHVFFDLVNSYGVVLFFPFSNFRPEFACVFIIDPWIWALLALPLIATKSSWPWTTRRTMARFSLVALCLYISLCFVGRGQAVSLLEQKLKRTEISADYIYVFPALLGPHRFKGVVRVGQEYSVFLIHLLDGEVEFKYSEKTLEPTPELERVQATPEAKKLDWFFAAPVWTVVEGQEDVFEVSDLRFSSVILGWKRRPFTYRFRLDGDTVIGPERVRRGKTEAAEEVDQQPSEEVVQKVPEEKNP